MRGDGQRRGRVAELANALRDGADAVVAFARRYSVVSDETGCWNWTGPKMATGYAYMVDPRVPIHRASMPRKAVHRIICEVVYRPMDDGEHARHLCHNKGCVNPEHLAPGSQSENMLDSVRDGHWTFTRGTGNGRAKMTESDVVLLRREFRPNTPGEAARWSTRFGVDQSNIRDAVAGRTWRHVPKEAA